MGGIDLSQSEEKRVIHLYPAQLTASSGHASLCPQPGPAVYYPYLRTMVSQSPAVAVPELWLTAPRRGEV